MKKLNLLFSMMILAVFASYGQYSSTSTLTCFPAPVGSPITGTFNNVPQPATAGVLTLYYQGDIDNATEYIEVFDENGVLIGQTIPSQNFADQCKATLDSIAFPITIADLTAWSADGIITFTITPQTTISTTLCTPCSGGQVKLEYAPLTGPDDAATTSVDSPYVFCAGMNDVVATIRNSGTNQLNSVDVNWEVNGVVQPVFAYTTTLDTLGGVNPSSAQINLGTAMFVAGNNTVKVYTSNPNGVADTSNVNDTVTVVVVSAAPPTAIVTLNPTLTSMDVNAVGGAGTVDYEYGPTGFALGTGTTGSSATSTFTISGLTQGTVYDIYVRSNCGNNDTSRYTGPQTFNTSYGLPFAQDFENFPNALINNPFPEGWSTRSTTPGVNPRWESELAQGFSPNWQTGPIWDHTNYGGPGTYMFMNSSGGPRDSVDLISPSIQVSPTVDEIELGYWHFNFGAQIERLEVIADTNGVEVLLATHTGQIQATQQDPWLFNTQRLSGVKGQNVTIKFRGYSSAGFTRGDVAVDDITVDPILPLNTGVVEVQSPSGALCPGSVTPVVGVKNFGSNTIDSVNVVWDINGVLDSVMYVGTILAGDTASVTLGTVTFNSTTVYDVDFYTNRPNNGIDQFGLDDTLRINGLRTGLSGVYTLDPALAASASNFTSFSELEGSINNFGICGPATVNVAAGTYNDVLHLEFPNGLSATDRLTIDGGDSSLVTLTNDLSNDDAVLRFEGASYVTVKNMTISTSRVGNGNHAVVHFNEESGYDSLVAVRVTLDPTATFGAYGIMASSLPTNTFAAGLHVNNLVVMNSSFDGGDNSIRIIGNGGAFPALPGSGWTVGNKFINNTSTNADDIAFYFDDQDSIEVIGNTISDMRTTSNFTGYGIEMFDGMNFLITSNNIIAPYTGIYVTNANSGKTPDRPAEISNNMISVNVNHGLWTTNSLEVNYWNNSVYCGSTASATDAGIYLDDGFGTIVMDNLDFRNNVVYAPNVPAFRIDEPDTVFNKFDNNVYHTDGTDLFNIDGVIYADLASYQTAQPAFNSVSLSGDPQYASTTNLHIVGGFIDNSGDNSVPITVDIDGDSRPIAGSTTVDPGADEFDPPACPPVVGLRGRNLTSNSIDIVWDGVVGNYDYEVVFGGVTPGSGTRIVTTMDSILLTGLTSSTSYDVHVREICARGDTSIPLTYSFTTLIQGPLGVNCISGNASNVYTEEFDAIGGWTGDIVNQNVAGQTNRVWNIHDATTSSGTLTGPFGAHSGSNYIYYESSAGTPTVATIVSPAIDLTAVTDSAEMSFWMHAHGTEIGTFNLGVGTSATGPFTNVFTQTGLLQTAEADPYQNVGVRLDSYVGQTIYLEFEMNHGAGFYGDLAIDLLEINSCISCATPNTLVDSNLTPTSIDLGWIQNGAALGWEVEYGFDGFAIGTGTRVPVAAAPLSLTGLTAISSYDWYVRAICAPGDTSAWAAAEFDTPCLPYTGTYTTGFEGMTTDVNADCWSDLVTYANGNVWVRAFGGVNGPSAGTQALYIFPSFGYTANDTLAAISPQFTDLTSGNKRVRFDANTDDIAMQLIVGTTDIPGSGGTFTPLDTLSFAAPDVYANYTVEVTTANGYNGTDQYVYFRHSLPVGNTFDYIRIDEFNYEDIPTCTRPTNPTATNTTATTVDIGWTNGTTPATQWEVEYGLQGFTPGTGTPVIATTNPVTVTGLTAGTIYEAYVRAICSPGDTSFRDVAVGFFTDCAAITATSLPFIEDWETGGSGTVQGSGIVKCGTDFQWALTSSTASGRARFGTAAFNVGAAPSTGAITLDMDVSGAVTFNELILTLDLSAQTTNTNLSLTFDAMEHGEENNPGDSTWIRGSDTDPWVGILDNFANITNTVSYDPFGPFDIDALLAAAGQTVSSTFQVRFGQEDNFPAPSDGFSFDNIAIYDAVTNIEEITTAELFAITPNPSNGLFTLNMKVDQSEDFTMTVRDVKGQVVYTENLTVKGAYTNNLDFTSFAKGVYYMQIQTETASKVEKLVIQ